LRPSDLGFPRADFILLQKDCASELPEGLLEITVRSSRQTFRLFRVDSVKEAEWRRRNNFPEERTVTAAGR
jgi:hypothetical protein